MTVRVTTGTPFMGTIDLRERAAAKWVSIIEDRLEDSDFRDLRESGKKSRAWYRNRDQYSDTDKANWEGDIVRGNLWNRDLRTLRAGIAGTDPVISVTTHLQDDEFNHAASAVASLATKVASETSTFRELERCYIVAQHDTISYAKLHWDEFRQVPGLKWCDGDVVFDKVGRGVMNRARWVCEVIHRPLADVLADVALPKASRDELRRQLNFTAQGTLRELDYDREVKMYYIWSKNGATPWRKYTGRKLVIICEEMLRQPMLVDDWPWPFLDVDEYPIIQLNLDELPGSLAGSSPFATAEPVLKQYNWLSSYMQTGVRREMTKKVLHTDAVEDPSKLTSGKHLEPIKVNSPGGPGDAVKVIDFTGKGPQHAMAHLQFVKSQHDEQVGVTDLLRGQALGGRTTAQETRTLERNASAVLRAESRIVDRFYNRAIRLFCFALLHYVPQWSRVVQNTDPILIGKEKTLVTKEWDPAVGWVIREVADSEAAQIGDISIHPEGYIARPGVDAWIGDDQAAAWLVYDLEQLRRDFSFEIEAGSARSDHAAEEQRNATTLMSSLWQPFMDFQCYTEAWELINYYVRSFRIPNSKRFIPPREKFQMGPTFLPQSTPSGSRPPNADGDKASPIQQPGLQNQNAGFGPGGQPEPEGRSEANLSIIGEAA